MKKLGILVCLVSLATAVAVVAQLGGMMYVEFRIQSNKGQPVAQPNKLWVARDKFMRLEQPPDSTGQTEPILVVWEPNAWVLNAKVQAGFHIVDPGPSYVVRPMIFGTTNMAKLRALEFGREGEFFDHYDVEQLPLKSFDSSICFGFRIKVDSALLSLYSDSTTGVPKRLFMAVGQETTTVIYDKYLYELPVDTTLFRPPAGYQIRVKK